MQASSNTAMILIPLCLGGVFFLIGAGVLIYALIMRKKANTAQAWPAVSGQVYSSSVREQHHEDSEGNVSWTYTPEVMYQYNVAGAVFQAKRIAFGAAGSGKRQTAEQVAARYQPGQTVTVYYNPQNPGDAVLERQVQNGRTLLILGGVFLAVSLCACSAGLILAIIQPV